MTVPDAASGDVGLPIHLLDTRSLLHPTQDERDLLLVKHRSLRGRLASWSRKTLPRHFSLFEVQILGSRSGLPAKLGGRLIVAEPGSQRRLLPRVERDGSAAQGAGRGRRLVSGGNGPRGAARPRAAAPRGDRRGEGLVERDPRAGPSAREDPRSSILDCGAPMPPRRGRTDDHT